MDKKIIVLASELKSLYEETYRIYEPLVNTIIENKVQDINYIEHTLDYIMGIYTDKGFNLFLKLCTYYGTVNYENALAYLEILLKERKEECDEYIEKHQKTKKK